MSATFLMTFSVSGKIYGRILNERMMKMTDESVGDEQGGFRKGCGCVDQVFELKILVEKVGETSLREKLVQTRKEERRGQQEKTGRKEREKTDFRRELKEDDR